MTWVHTNRRLLGPVTGESVEPRLFGVFELCEPLSWSASVGALPGSDRCRGKRGDT